MVDSYQLKFVGGEMEWPGSFQKLQEKVHQIVGWPDPNLMYWTEPVIQTTKKNRKLIDQTITRVIWQIVSTD